jgi:hypothetical protein
LVIEGGNEEYAGIALGIITNVVQFAINAIEKIIPHPPSKFTIDRIRNECGFTNNNIKYISALTNTFCF